MVITSPYYDATRTRPSKESRMPNEFSGIEKRLDELNERLARLEPLLDRERTDVALFAKEIRNWLSEKEGRKSES
jgi:hypothetical protein